jgi:hypothetical protein
MTRQRATAGVRTRVRWRDILERGRAIVEGYDTGVTLRQLFYRLVAALLLPNLQSYYRRLSSYTAEARRQGTFPDLLDQTSDIERSLSFDSPEAALRLIRNLYRRDRTEGQKWSIYLGVEKAGMLAQLRAWFGEPLGLPILALGGYASQTLVGKVRADITRQQRPAVFVYSGDHDPSGEDVDRDFVERVGLFERVERVALGDAQVTEFSLPFNPDPAVMEKLENDPRAAAFEKRHGSLVQYELDALPPETLRYFVPDRHRRVLESGSPDRRAGPRGAGAAAAARRGEAPAMTREGKATPSDPDALHPLAGELAAALDRYGRHRAAGSPFLVVRSAWAHANFAAIRLGEELERVAPADAIDAATVVGGDSRRFRAVLGLHQALQDARAAGVWDWLKGPAGKRSRPVKVSKQPAPDLSALLARVRLAAEELGGAEEKETPEPRLIVDVDRMTLTLDDVTHDVPSELALRWVKVLSDHAGQWLSGAELRQFDPDLDGVRTDRLLKRLPEPVQQLIESSTGRGSRLTLA